MQLTNVTLINFKTHRHMELSITPGIVGIMGHNGAGKSSILEGIYFGLTGKTLNGEPKGDLKTWGSTTDSLVEVQFVHEKKQYTLTRYVNKNAATLVQGDTKIIGITEVGDYLNRIIKADYDILKQVLFVAQEQLDTPLKGTESSRKDAFGKLFGCDKLEKIRDAIQSFANENLVVNKLVNEATIEALEAELKELITRYETVVEKEAKPLEAEINKYPSTLEIAQRLNRKAKEDVNAEIEKLIETLDPIAEDIDRIKRMGIAKTKETLLGELHEVNAKLDMVRQGICPTCHTVLKKVPYNADELTKEATRIKDDLKMLERLDYETQRQNSIIEKIRTLKEDLPNCISKEESDALRKQYQTVKNMAERIAQLHEQEASLIATIDVKEKLLNSYDAQLKQNRKIMFFADKLNKIRAAFHRDAIQNDLRTFGAKAINDSLTECLAVFNVPYTVYFTPDGLAKFKDNVVHQERDFSSLSGGQKKLVSLAYRLALMKLFTNDLNICVLDEPTSFIDTANIEAMKNAFIALQEFAQHNNMTIFIATHEYSLVPIFDTLIDLG